MKRIKQLISVSIFLVLILAMSFSVFAADSTVTYDGKLSSTAATTEIGDILPGDTVEYTVEFENKSDKSTDWYVKNTIVEAFEESVDASGGAYSYTLAYINPSGSEKVLYSNEELGGFAEGSTSDAVGLKQVSSGTEEDIYLDTLSAGQKGQVKVTVTLDGETQGNAYANAAANLNLVFAVEPIETTTTVVTVYVPNTGDNTNVIMYAAVFGLTAISIMAVLLLKKKANKEEE
ncbi:MAG: LPXTG cell wall anchor domain-containing protein [Oscillospiraceae bacterium]|nr:LPXTG cell wall anchor domain-containing protein [Oscillospiraceae bacterium]MBR0452030.1 LPXTG cell wall anchor domain-containing protein [Oscillospiraceae bacterium]